MAERKSRDALRALQQRRREDALKLKALRLRIKSGVVALDRGKFAEIDDKDLDGHLEGLTATAGKGAR